MENTFFCEQAIGADQIARILEKNSKYTQAGAQDLFLGQIRADIIDNKEVAAIEFSAYKEMAEQALQKIVEEKIREYQLYELTILHSLGQVHVGEVCMVVNVCAGHRNEAFVACREIVEAIKFEVPIFGKEIFTDNSHTWKVNK